MAKFELIKDDLSGDVIDQELPGNFVDGRPVDLFFDHKGKTLCFELHLKSGESDLPNVQDLSAKTIRKILTGATFEKNSPVMEKRNKKS